MIISGNNTVNASFLLHFVEKALNDHSQNGKNLAISSIVTDGDRNVKRARMDYSAKHKFTFNFTCIVYLLNTSRKKLLGCFEEHLSNIKTFISVFTKGHRLITMLKAERLASWETNVPYSCNRKHLI